MTVSLTYAVVYFQAAGVSNLEPVAYEFFTQAFMIYEEEIAVCGAFFSYNCNLFISAA